MTEPAAAWVYRRQGSNWIQESLLGAPGYIAYQGFGTAAALDRSSGVERAMVGCRYLDLTAGNDNAGGVVIYEHRGSRIRVRRELIRRLVGGAYAFASVEDAERRVCEAGEEHVRGRAQVQQLPVRLVQDVAMVDSDFDVTFAVGHVADQEVVGIT